jgi:hypothetical protein
MAMIRQFVRTLLAWQVHVAVIVTVLAWSSDRSLTMRVVNELVYDRFVQFDARLTFAPDNVLIVYADRELDRRPGEYLRLIDQLRELGAAGFGITQLSPADWTSNQWDQLLTRGDVILGDIRPQPSESSATEIPHSVDLPATPDGVHRHWRTHDENGRETFPFAVALRFCDTPLSLSHIEFGVSFRGGAESLPHVTADAILDDQITSPLVRDRIVLIGRPPDPLLPGLVTPTSGSDWMSIPEFHGHVVNSLVAKHWYQTASSPVTVCLYMLGGTGFLLFGRRARLRRALLCFLLITTAEVALGFLIFWKAGFWLPLATLIIVQLIAAAWSFHARLRFSSQAWQVTRRHGFTVSPRYRSHPHLDPSVEPWELIISFLQHMFPLDRIALLVADDTRSRLRLASFAGCQDEDIVERRRDLRRHPFSDANERKTTLQIDETRPFFERRPAQCQFICPLMYLGRLQGMVIVELSRTALQRQLGFTQSLQDACDEIAPWIARYGDLRRIASRQKRWWNRWSVSSEQETFEALQRYLQSLERHMHQSYAVIESASSGKAVFDLSGNLVTLNAEMFRILHRCGISSHEARLLPTIRSLSKRDILECRELVRRVLMQGRRERAVVSDPHGTSTMLLVISPLTKSLQSSNDPSQLVAFDAQGIQLEAYEADLLNDLHFARDHVTDQGFTVVEDLLSEVISLTDALQYEDLEVAQQRLQLSASQARRTIQQCQSMLANGQSEAIEACMPLRIEAVIRAAVVETRSLAEKCGAAVELSIPRELPDVSANPHRIRQALATGMEVLMEHARDHSVINVTAASQPEFVTVTLHNEGCGVALEQLAAIRRSRPDRPHGSAARLFDQAVWVRSWGGDLTVQSELGEGASIQYTLPRFHWGERQPGFAREQIRQ